MTEPTLRQLCERVIAAWSDYQSTTVRSSRTCDAYHDACYTLGKRLHIDASMWNDLTAKTILAALNAAEEQGRAHAMAKVVERGESNARQCSSFARSDRYFEGREDALVGFADWARERLLEIEEKI